MLRACADGEEIPILAAQVVERKNNFRTGKATFGAQCEWDTDCPISIECDGVLLFVGHIQPPKTTVGAPCFDAGLVGIWNQAHQVAMPAVPLSMDAAKMAALAARSYAGFTVDLRCESTVVERDWSGECVTVGKAVEELADAAAFEFVTELGGTCEKPTWRIVICPDTPEVTLAYPGEVCDAKPGEFGRGYTDLCVLGKDGLRSDQRLDAAKRRRLKTVKLSGIDDQSQLDYAARTILAGCSDADGQCVVDMRPDCPPPPLCSHASVSITDVDPVSRAPLDHIANYKGRKQVVQRRWTIAEGGTKTVTVWLGQQPPPTATELFAALIAANSGQ